jgi:hypothetical protein
LIIFFLYVFVFTYSFIGGDIIYLEDSDSDSDIYDSKYPISERDQNFYKDAFNALSKHEPIKGKESV